MNKPFVCALVGPTASGKTEAALRVAEALGMEIVSVDSMQVYRGMDIGTAKATKEERARVPHHMIDCADPSESYTAARFQAEGRAAIADINARGKTPLLVGGTGLYLSALADGMNFADQVGDSETRSRWVAYRAEHGNYALHARLAERDPQTAARLHPNDARRVIRALEVFEETGEPMSRRVKTEDSPYTLRVAGLMVEREELYRRIDERVVRMIKTGLVEEARRLFSADASTAAQALGYKELFAMFRGESTLAEAIALIQRRTRRYAKRQMTWFRRDERIRWFDAPDDNLPGKLIDYFAQTENVVDPCTDCQ
jgi:tRNA dimethylallyltransferase